MDYLILISWCGGAGGGVGGGGGGTVGKSEKKHTNSLGEAIALQLSFEWHLYYGVLQIG